MPIRFPRSAAGTNTMSTSSEPQSERPHNPPISSPVAGSFNSIASVRDVASPTVCSLKASSGCRGEDVELERIGLCVAYGDRRDADATLVLGLKRDRP